MFEGEPEVGDGGVEAEIAFEVFECGAGLGRDLGAEAVAFAFGQRRAFVGAGLGLDRLACLVQGLDGSDPGITGAENLSDLAGGHAVVGQGDDAMTELGGQGFHGGHLSIGF